MEEPEKSKLLTKEEFLQQYVLNRASASGLALDGVGAAREASYAWNQIKFIMEMQKDSNDE